MLRAGVGSEGRREIFGDHECEGFPRWVRGKESACQCRTHRRLGFDHWVRKISWRRKWQTLHYSCLWNSMDRGASRLQPMGLHRVRHDWAHRHTCKGGHSGACCAGGCLSHATVHIFTKAHLGLNEEEHEISLIRGKKKPYRNNINVCFNRKAGNVFWDPSKRPAQ